MINIILSGGSGTRLWPISREQMPKQFLKIFDKKSLFELTLERNSSFCSKFVVVSNIEQFFLAKDQLGKRISSASFILEPFGRNTAPAIAAACFSLNDDDIVLVTPSDHMIKDGKSYEQAVKKAEKLAESNFLVTFGIVAKNANTGYEYIQAEGENVISFKEKPSAKEAKLYIEKGYCWNSGMFCFKAGIFLNELKKYRPDIYENTKKAYENAEKDIAIRISNSDMEDIPSESIDYAVMENSKNVKVVRCSIGWSDVGSFDSLSEEFEEDGCLILADKNVELIDISDLIVVDTKDALLICKKGSSQKVKNIVERLKTEKPNLTKYHLTASRPWGTYTILAENKGYKIKTISVAPKRRLSLQRHKYRNEHWIVVQGTARVTVEDKVFELSTNESTYIKAGEIHRLENPTDEELIIVEAQVGDYLGEDDIERLQDDYKRG